jgi:phage-related tail fiber protein
MEYYTLLTATGINKIVNAQANGTELVLNSFAVGDGGDGYYEPDENQTELVNETYRNYITRIYADSNYTNRLVIECAIPPSSGGYYIREVGIFDNERNLFAIASIPESYKPLEDEGSTRDFYIKVIIEIENLNDINLIIDPSVSVVSLDYLENHHNTDPNAHYRLIDADKVDGHHAGNSANQVAVSNETVCENLNADLVDGHHAGNESNNVLVLDENGIVPEENLNHYAPQEHTHQMTDIITSEAIHGFHNMHIESGVNEGTTSYVYPPEGFTMADLLAFIPSSRTIYYSGDVDYNDSLYCYWEKDNVKITITCYNSEQRYTPSVNWLAIWRKNIPQEN